MSEKYTNIDKLLMLGFRELESDAPETGNDDYPRVFVYTENEKVIVISKCRNTKLKYKIWYDEKLDEPKNLTEACIINMFNKAFVVRIFYKGTKYGRHSNFIYKDLLLDAKLKTSEEITTVNVEVNMISVTLMNSAITLVYPKCGDSIKLNTNREITSCGNYLEISGKGNTDGFVLLELKGNKLITRKSGGHYSRTVISEMEKTADFIDNRGNIVGEPLKVRLFTSDKLTRKSVETLVAEIIKNAKRKENKRLESEDITEISVLHLNNSKDEYYSVIAQITGNVVINLFCRLDNETDLFEYIRLCTDEEKIEEVVKQRHRNTGGKIMYEVESLRNI